MPTATQFSKTFTGTEDFAALSDAEQWLREHGFSYGSLQRESPVGIMHGDYAIMKWRNLSDEDRKELDGVIEQGDKRTGPVTITIYNAELVK